MSDPYRDVYLEANGLRHHLVERGRPGDRPIILIPAQTSQGHALDATATRLAPDHHVVSQDPRGRGDTDWGPSDGYTIDSYVEDLEATRVVLQLDRVALLGSHLGGVVAMYYAARYPERVTGVILNDIAPELNRDSARKYVSRIVDTPESFPDIESVMAFYRQAYPDTLGKQPDEALRRHSTWQVRWTETEQTYRWKMDPAARGVTPWPTSPSRWEMFAAIAAPVLLVRGDRSELVSRETADRMVRDGCDCEVVDVPGVNQTATLLEPESIAGIDRLLAKV